MNKFKTAYKSLYSKLLAAELRDKKIVSNIVTLSAGTELSSKQIDGQTVQTTTFEIELEPSIAEYGRGKMPNESAGMLDYKDPDIVEKIQELLDLRHTKDLTLVVEKVLRGDYNLLVARGYMYRNSKAPAVATYRTPEETVPSKSTGKKLFNLMWVDNQLDLIVGELDEQSQDPTIADAIEKIQELKALFDEYAEEEFE